MMEESCMKSSLSIGFALLSLLAGCATANGVDALQRAQEALKAGYQRHDASEFFSIWSADAKKIEGRSEKPDKFDTTLTRAQFESVRKLQWAAPPLPNVEVNFDEVSNATLNDNMASVRFKLTVKPAETYYGPMRSVTSGESIRFQMINGQWRVIEWRSWPIEARGEDYIQKWDAGQWEAHDHRVETANTQGELVGALIAAHRFREAHEKAKEWTQSEGTVQLKPNVPVWMEGGAKQANAWLARGYAAILTGDAADAKAAFRKALALDATASMPDYARAAGK
jgi:tetratricopeptide (TPR) repeat protein